MEIIPIKTKLFKKGDNLTNFFLMNFSHLEDGDVVAITSKIISISQNRFARLKDKKDLITKISREVIETPWASMTLTDDGWCINAGIDESNSNNEITLLPEHIFETTECIRKTLMKNFCLKKLGVIITDTKSLPLRVGTIGRTIGYAGFQPLKSYIGKKDLFGKKSRFTKSNVADALSASAVLVMGEGDEQIPLVIIKNAPIKFTNKSNVNKKDGSLVILPRQDIYSYVYKKQ